ncbi:MAG: 23S rRNA (adenine(2503)-C2)-methyltransferase, partial [Calditrichaeota bacterium]
QAARERITFEYVLLAGVNDRLEDARSLRKIVQEFDCVLNLIPFNTTYSVYRRPEKDAIFAFYKEFEGSSVPVTIRWSKGTDIDAACGQLVTKTGNKPLRNEKKREAFVGTPNTGQDIDF